MFVSFSIYRIFFSSFLTCLFIFFYIGVTDRDASLFPDTDVNVTCPWPIPDTTPAPTTIIPPLQPSAAPEVGVGDDGKHSNDYFLEVHMAISHDNSNFI